MESVERKKFIDRDMIKYLAVIPMGIGHFCGYLSGGTLYADMPFWVFFIMHAALFAPPVFFFFIAEGFRYTRSRKRYALRLLVFALINQIPFCLANYGTLLTVEFFLNWNIIFTLFLGLLALLVWESGKKLPVRIVLIVLIDIVTVLLSSEWMIFGVLLILGFHVFHDKPRARLVWFLCTISAMQLVIAVLSFCGWFYTIAALVIETSSMLLAYYLVTHHYSGEKGRHPVFAKWFFYLFYPLHLWAIYVIGIFIS